MQYIMDLLVARRSVVEMKQVYAHETCATDTNACAKVLRSVIDTSRVCNGAEQGFRFARQRQSGCATQR